MPSQNEVSLLRDQITEEVNRDAEVIGHQLFAGNVNTREPDLGHVSEDTLRAVYRQKFLDQDREWLTNEATRDPQQFMRVARSINVVDPSELPPGTQPGPTPLEAAAQVAQPVPIAAPTPPPALPAPMTAPAPPVVPPAPSLPSGGPVDPALVQAALAAAQQQVAPQPAAAPLPLGM